MDEIKNETYSSRIAAVTAAGATGATAYVNGRRTVALASTADGPELWVLGGSEDSCKWRRMYDADLDKL